MKWIILTVLIDNEYYEIEVEYTVTRGDVEIHALQCEYKTIQNLIDIDFDYVANIILLNHTEDLIQSVYLD